MDAALGNSPCPWLVTIIVEDIKIFLDDYPHVSLYWVNRLANIVTHENVHWICNVIKSGSGSISEVPPSVEVVCYHEQLLI